MKESTDMAKCKVSENYTISPIVSPMKATGHRICFMEKVLSIINLLKR